MGFLKRKHHQVPILPSKNPTGLPSTNNEDPAAPSASQLALKAASLTFKNSSQASNGNNTNSNNITTNNNNASHRQRAAKTATKSKALRQPQPQRGIPTINTHPPINSSNSANTCVTPTATTTTTTTSTEGEAAAAAVAYHQQVHQQQQQQQQQQHPLTIRNNNSSDLSVGRLSLSDAEFPPSRSRMGSKDSSTTANAAASMAASIAAKSIAALSSEFLAPPPPPSVSPPRGYPQHNNQQQQHSGVYPSSPSYSALSSTNSIDLLPRLSANNNNSSQSLDVNGLQPPMFSDSDYNLSFDESDHEPYEIPPTIHEKYNGSNNKLTIDNMPMGDITVTPPSNEPQIDASFSKPTMLSRSSSNLHRKPPPPDSPPLAGSTSDINLYLSKPATIRRPSSPGRRKPPSSNEFLESEVPSQISSRYDIDRFSDDEELPQYPLSSNSDYDATRNKQHHHHHHHRGLRKGAKSIIKKGLKNAGYGSSSTSSKKNRHELDEGKSYQPQHSVSSSSIKPVQLKTTMRKEKKDNFNEDKPWKHHTDFAYITEQERKRYEGLWVSNRGLYMDKVDPTSLNQSYEVPGQINTALKASVLSTNGTNSNTAVPIGAMESNLMLNLVVRQLWARSRLNPDTLRQIWELVDTRKDGTLDKTSFIVGMWLVDQCLYGRKLPKQVDEAVWQSVSPLGVNVVLRGKKKGK